MVSYVQKQLWASYIYEGSTFFKNDILVTLVILFY